MKKSFVAAVVVLMSTLTLSTGITSSSVSANPVGVFVSNTALSSNIGLGFCQPGGTKGCIESITVDGVSLTPVVSTQQASFVVGGGVYSSPCQFVGTTVSQCEFPYLVLWPIRPGASPYLNDVEIKFKRQTFDHPTSAVGAVIVNGALQSFEPAAPGLRDVATIRARTTDIHVGTTGFCVGWVTEIDTCTVADTATYKYSNRLSMLLLPGMKSSVVPPDEVDTTCRQRDPSGKCLVNVFDESSRGGWVDTDASVFGLASTDRYTGAAQLKIAGPHYKLPVNGSSELNLSNFRMYLPSPYLNASFGLSPSQANATTLPVRRTVGSGSTTPATEYIPTASGLLVSSTGIGFSAPTMTIQRVLTVKRNQPVTATALLKAAGVHQALKIGSFKIAVNSKNGMTFRSKRYRFSKTKSVFVTIKYHSSKFTISERRLTVLVTK